jgi:hypothetical protein
MEVIKRKINLEQSTDRSTEKHWGTVTATTFYINVLVTQSIDDMGLFTDLEYIPKLENFNNEPDYTLLTNKLLELGITFPFMNGVITPYFNTITTPQNLWDVLRFPLNKVEKYYNYTKTVITGLTESRIEDIRTYDIANPFKIGFDMNKELYENYEGDNILGIDRLVSDGEPKIYVFDASDDFDLGTVNQKTGLYFEDYNTLRRINIEGETQSVNKTVVKYVGEGLNQTNTSLSAITKEEYLFGKIFPPEVQNDVFIERGTNSVLDKHLRLSEIRNIGGLEKYGNGFYKINKQ